MMVAHPHHWIMVLLLLLDDAAFPLLHVDMSPLLDAGTILLLDDDAHDVPPIAP